MNSLRNVRTRELLLGPKLARLVQLPGADCMVPFMHSDFEPPVSRAACGAVRHIVAARRSMLVALPYQPIIL